MSHPGRLQFLRDCCPECKKALYSSPYLVSLTPWVDGWRPLWPAGGEHESLLMPPLCERYSIAARRFVCRGVSALQRSAAGGMGLTFEASL